MAARVASRFARPAFVAAAAMAVPAAVWMQARVASSAPSAEMEKLANTPPKGALDPNEFRGFKLLSVTQLTHDTAKYTFELPHENDELGLVAASCLVVKGEADGEAHTGRVGRRQGTGLDFASRGWHARPRDAAAAPGWLATQHHDALAGLLRAAVERGRRRRRPHRWSSPRPVVAAAARCVSWRLLLRLWALGCT